MGEERHDIVHRSAPAGAGRPGMAAGRLTLAEASPARIAGRIERHPLQGAPDGALAPSPGIGFDAPARIASGAASVPASGPEAWIPAIPNWAYRGAASRVNGGPKRGGREGRFAAWECSGEAQKSGAMTCGAEGPLGVRKSKREQSVAADFRGRGTGFRGPLLLAITVVIRSKMSISLVHVRPGAPPAGHGPGLPAPSKPLIYNGFWKFPGENPTVPAPGLARRRRRLLLAITVSGFRTGRARGASDSPATAPCRCLIVPDPGCHASLAAHGHSRCCRRASWAAPLRRASRRSP